MALVKLAEEPEIGHTLICAGIGAGEILLTVVLGRLLLKKSEIA